MCGRYGFTKPKEQIIKRFGLTRVPDELPLLFNISPNTKVPVILNKYPNELALINWGLVRKWSPEEKPKIRPINARCETIMEKPFFKGPLKTNRCLILASEFYEWKKSGDKKIPYRIFLKNEEPFAFAGIWDRWGEGDKQSYSCVIITTSANRLMSGIHDRMPVILDPEDESKWMSDIPMNFVLSMLRSYPAEKLDAYSISDLVNSPTNNSPDIIKPLSV